MNLGRLLRRQTGRKYVVFVDAFGFFSGLKIFSLALFNRVESIRYLSVDSWGGKWADALGLLGLCSDVGELTPDLTSQMPESGSVWDWLHLTVQTRAEAMVNRLLAAGTFLSYLPASISIPRQRAFLRKMVQRDIYNPLMLVLSARQEQCLRSEGAQAVVLVNLSDLTPVLEEVLSDSANVRLIGYADLVSLLPVMLVWFLRVQVRHLAQRFYSHWVVRRRENHVKPATVAVQHVHGLGGRLFGTNDLWWYSKSGLAPERCLVYFDRSRFPATDQAIRDLEERGYRYRILNSAANATSGLPTDGIPTQSASRTIADLGLLFRVLLKASQFVAPIWQISRWLIVLVSLRRWQNLMEMENIKVLFSVEETGHDVMSLAADLVGAIRVGYHWSALYPINARLVPFHQVYFVWGSRYQSVVVDRLGGYSEAVLQSGCIFDDADVSLVFQDSAAELRQQLQSSGVQHIVSVLDRSLGRTSYYPADRHIQFYEGMLAWAEANPRIGLLIKPKHWDGPRVFDYAPELAPRFQALVSEGRVVLLDGKRSVIEAALASDVVVALGYNSGGVVAALSGARTVFWDAAEMHKGPLRDRIQRLEEYNSDVFFTDLSYLVKSVQRYFECPSAMPGLGDLSPALDEIDPFRDGKTAHRVGSFVRWFLEGLDQGMDRTEALRLAVCQYQSEWGGADKVFSRL